MREAGRAISEYEDWKPEMVRLADSAAADGRTLNASIYCRSAEFYTLPGDPDRELLYDRFRELFAEAFRGDEMERVRIPYDGAYLPAIRLAPKGARRGTVLLHGGYDSFLEEWYLLMSTWPARATK